LVVSWRMVDPAIGSASSTTDGPLWAPSGVCHGESPRRDVGLMSDMGRPARLAREDTRRLLRRQSSPYMARMCSLRSKSGPSARDLGWNVGRPASHAAPHLPRRRCPDLRGTRRGHPIRPRRHAGAGDLRELRHVLGLPRRGRGLLRSSRSCRRDDRAAVRRSSAAPACSQCGWLASVLYPQGLGRSLLCRIV
jgi:hypothetical protein